MNSFFGLFVAWGVLLLLILSFYLIDKVNTMYKAQVPPEIPKTYSDGLFGELVGKTLWDAMSGIPLPGIDTKLVEGLKPHYEPVLRQHIELAFMDGFRNGKEQKAGVPPNNCQIPTPRGSLESWLPLHHLASIYQAGLDFAMNKPEDHLMLQQNLDQVTAMLYARTGLAIADPYSETLLKLPIAAGLMQPPVEPGADGAPLALEGQSINPMEPGLPGAPPEQMISDLAQSLSGFDGMGGDPPPLSEPNEPAPVVLPMNLPNPAALAV